MGKPTPETPDGNVRYTEKWDGSTSADVKLTTLRLDLRANASHPKEFLHAMIEYEAASKELKLATRSGVAEWLDYAQTRHRVAFERMQEQHQ